VNKRIPHAQKSIIAAAAALLLTAACTPAPKETKIAEKGTEVSGTVELWHFFTEREAAAIDTVIKDFTSTHPNIKVTVKPGQDDSKMTQAIGGGQGPDVGLSYSTDIVGQFCASGAWLDLGQYLTRDKVNLDGFPQTVREYTQYKNKRCAMPVLADAYGLYYNKKLFAEAGIAGPPKTLEEFADAAKKLTKRSADGTIQTAGFLPLWGFYENAPSHLGPMVGGQWLKGDGTSAIGTDPAWQTLLKWQKELVDWYGFDKLEAFRASLGDEYSDANAFQKGQVAMNFDGEYRIAFAKDQAPDLQFGVAPMPTSSPDRYGAGYVTGNVIGISRTAKNPEAAWELIKYLTTNTKTIVKLANSLKNIPSTKEALASPDLKLDAEFKVFVDIFNHPKTSTTPPSSAGPAYQETFQTFCDTWQSGGTTDLGKGLSDVDKQINSLLQLGG
jgi:multiple sugar transport system substrate-binding protein